MSYIELLPDDLILSILDTRCDNIEKTISELETIVVCCDGYINDNDDFNDDDVNDYDDDEDDTDEDYYIELENQRYQDDIYINNIILNISY
tara:strand:+ start:2424 stop:2696 length:273 start_codon:yes stop_codon:yes gene_type:complete